MSLDKRSLYKLISFMSFSHHFTQPFFFEGKAIEMKLHCFCIISAIALCIEHIKTRMENCHLYLLLMEIYAKLMHGEISMLNPFHTIGLFL